MNIVMYQKQRLFFGLKLKIKTFSTPEDANAFFEVLKLKDKIRSAIILEKYGRSSSYMTRRQIVKIKM